MLNKIKQYDLEEKISKKKAKELFEKNMLVELPAGKFSTLQFIHKYLFDEVTTVQDK